MTRVYTRTPWSVRLWAKIDVQSDLDACWFWTGSQRNGYGCLEREPVRHGKREYAHRLMAELVTGARPPRGAVVRHTCESRYAPGDISHQLCCNPAHLAVGTQKQNVHDMLVSGRHVAPPGLRNGRHKLTDDIVRQIRERYAAGGCVLRGSTWAHVPGDRT